jgi:Zn-dependent protease
MLKLRNRHGAQPLLAEVNIGPGGLVLVLLLTSAFGIVGARAGLPVVMAALLGAVGGTASLLVHELGHVCAARRAEGISSAVISFYWLGAVTRFEGRYEDGRQQWRVAVAGPLASFAVATSLVATCFLPMPFHVKAAVLLLAVFNVALGVLNLLPAHPLDGHNLAVGLLWAITGSEQKARRVLRRIGIGWAALEAPAAGLFVVERPNLGLVVSALCACLVMQKRLARRAPAAQSCKIRR